MCCVAFEVMTTHYDRPDITQKPDRMLKSLSSHALGRHDVYNSGSPIADETFLVPDRQRSGTRLSARKANLLRF